MKAEIVGNQLIITMEMCKPHLSSTGKSWVIATTGRTPQRTEAEIDGKSVRVSVTAYFYENESPDPGKRIPRPGRDYRSLGAGRPRTLR